MDASGYDDRNSTALDRASLIGINLGICMSSERTNAQGDLDPLYSAP
jgi:hypothetical protein